MVGVVSVKIVFQPAEEIAQGASWMIREGVMRDVSAVFVAKRIKRLAVVEKARCQNFTGSDKHGYLSSALLSPP